MIKVNISDGDQGEIASIRKTEQFGSTYPAGVVSYTTPYRLESNRPISAVNESGSSAMNINGSSTGGTPDNVHNGTDNSYWTGTNLTGSNFVFDSTAQAASGTKSIDGSATIDNDEALLTRSAAITISDYTALTGQIYVDSWSDTGIKDIGIRIRISGTDIGITVNVSPYINTDNQGAWQGFSIPLTDFGLSGTSFDELVIKTIDNGGGQPPNYYIDDLVFASSAASGAPVSFRVAPRKNEIILVKGFVYNMVFPWNPVSTVAGATENFIANQFLSYNSFAHLSALSIGLNVKRVQGDVVGFSNVIRNNFDLLKATNHRIDTFFADDTNVMMKVTTHFEGPVELNANLGDYYEFTVNDNLSSLLHFEIRGRATTINEALN